MITEQVPNKFSPAHFSEYKKVISPIITNNENK